MPIDPGTVLPSTQSSPEALPRYTLLVRESPRHEPPPYTRTRDAAVPGETRDRSRSALLERVSFDISDGKPRLFCFGEDDMVKRIWKIEWERGMEMGVVQRSSTRTRPAARSTPLDHPATQHLHFHSPRRPGELRDQPRSRSRGAYHPSPRQHSNAQRRMSDLQVALEEIRMEMERIRRDLKMTKRGRHSPISAYLEDLRSRKVELETEMETLRASLRAQDPAE